MKLRVEEVSKSFGSNGNIHQVLDQTSFGVKVSQFVTLLGPSGCGKTTILTIMAGFQAADSGRILVDGHIVTKPGPDRGFIFQDYALFPWMTVRENILYPMKLQKVNKEAREERLQKLLALATLNGKEHLYPHQLSGGMKQRTAVIRALANEPEVLLMDEPLGAVDFQMRQGLQEELEAIWLKAKPTVVMVTHDVDEAIFLSDRVLVMSVNKGHILEDLKIELDRPRQRKGDDYHSYKDHLVDTLKLAMNRIPEEQKQEDAQAITARQRTWREATFR